MGNRLFENIGSKIMGIVKFVFYFNVVLVALAVLIGTILGMTDDFVTGLLILAIGAVVGAIYLLFVYVGMLCIYGFGELVQCNIDQRNLLRSMAGGRPAAAEPVVSARPVERAEKPREDIGWKPTTAHTGHKSAGKSICPRCGARQPEGAEKCKYCGTAIV